MLVCEKLRISFSYPEPARFLYENLRTSIVKAFFLIPSILLYTGSDTGEEALELYDDMRTKAAVGAGTMTCST
jgi:hypothetical protein